MKEIRENDENKLQELNKSIIKLKKEIEKLNKIKILNNKIKEKEKLEQKIIEFSTYKINQIGNVLVKLMSVFEKVKYSCEKDFFL